MSRRSRSYCSHGAVEASGLPCLPFSFLGHTEPPPVAIRFGKFLLRRPLPLMSQTPLSLQSNDDPERSTWWTSNATSPPPTTLAEHQELIGSGGIGNHTCLPEGMHKFPMDHSLSATIHVIHTVFFQIVHNLLADNDVHPRAIDLLVTNCSLTSPTPSLASMVVNRFGLRSNVKAYNLSGMGCSAGILARDVLNVHGNSLALIPSMESVSANFYRGDTKSMLLSNCLFRMGGARALLSNRPHIIRTHLGANNTTYEFVMQQHDAQGHTGVALSRLIMQVQ
ncbi:hypothetical protein SASPL_111563 [Salvia splendens]|uniref:FAE domain-containing protein n=1 Tax=Salvia splendens TaxID=180675 RepID=A0A8X8YCQ1_SALSN|nr:hypothetical protein SASPL_111563 [Salvia splendens]